MSWKWISYGSRIAFSKEKEILWNEFGKYCLLLFPLEEENAFEH
jgi:hypothetical protein